MNFHPKHGRVDFSGGKQAQNRKNPLRQTFQKSSPLHHEGLPWPFPSFTSCLLGHLPFDMPKEMVLRSAGEASGCAKVHERDGDAGRARRWRRIASSPCTIRCPGSFLMYENYLLHLIIKLNRPKGVGVILGAHYCILETMSRSRLPHSLPPFPPFRSLESCYSGIKTFVFLTNYHRFWLRLEGAASGQQALRDAMIVIMWRRLLNSWFVPALSILLLSFLISIINDDYFIFRDFWTHWTSRAFTSDGFRERWRARTEVFVSSRRSPRRYRVHRKVSFKIEYISINKFGIILFPNMVYFDLDRHLRARLAWLRRLHRRGHRRILGQRQRTVNTFFFFKLIIIIYFIKLIYDMNLISNVSEILRCRSCTGSWE